MGGGRVKIGDATTSRMRGRQYNNQPDKRPKRDRMVGIVQREERPRNSNERQQSGQKMQQPWAGEAMEGVGRGNGGCWRTS
jgi:hypothetical protein